MEHPYGYYMSDETLRGHIKLMQDFLDLVALCVTDHSDLATEAILVTLDSVAGMVDEAIMCMKRR